MITETIAGTWWIYGDNAPAFSGALHNSGRLSLVIDLPKSPTSDAHPLFVLADESKRQCSEIIHGRDSNGKPITLFGCHTGQHTWSDAHTRIEIDAITGIRGLRIESWRQPVVRVLSVKVEHLARWTGWHFYQMAKRQLEQPIAFTVDPPRDVKCTVMAGVEFRIEQSVHLKTGRDRLSVEPIGQFHFRFSEPQSLEEARQKWMPWAIRLLSLLFGTAATILEVEVHDRDNFTPVESIADAMGHDAVFLDKINPSKNVRISDPTFHNMVVRYPEIAAIFPAVISAWAEKQERLSPVISLFSAVALHHSLYDKAQFMFLVQALEIYHTRSGKFTSTELTNEERDGRLTRALAALPADLHDWARGKLRQNNKSLRAKLLDVLQAHAAETSKMFSDDLARIAHRIAYTRNQLTHHHEEVNADLLLSDLEITQVAWSLEALLWIILLRELGIDGAPVQRLLQRALNARFVSLRG